MTIDIRELHLLAFGECVAGVTTSLQGGGAYGQAGDPPVLLLSRGGFSGYGKSLADAGPTPVDGRIIRSDPPIRQCQNAVLHKRPGCART